MSALAHGTGGPIVGIDLGTTNSLVAICDARGPRIITDAAGDPIIPSVVRFEPDGSVVVGATARRERAGFPLTTIASVKRLMGRSADDAAESREHHSYNVRAGDRQTARIHLDFPNGSKVVSPEEVSAHILRALRDRASAALGTDVTRAVITVPAYFDDAQRQATRAAARLAGLDAVRIVNEPTAAALAYGLGVRQGDGRPSTIAVYDLGGGTFDISILLITPGAAPGERSLYQVLATAGDTALGGDDFDRALVELAIRESGRTIDPSEMQALAADAERVKRELSEADRSTIDVEMRDGGHVTREVTRSEFESLITPRIDETMEMCRRAMTDAARSLGIEGAPRIDAVVMVGGSSRIPLVRGRTGELFGIEPYIAINPDEAVALGAAVQGALLAGISEDALLLDVIPLSLGIETVGGAFAKIIMRNSTVPTRASEMFSTSVDGQTSIRLNVLQGEREMSADCRSLGAFHLRGIPAMPAGIPQVEVTFLVDANGVLNVTATERRSQTEATLQVIPSHGLTSEEVDRIERESFAHAREDMIRHRVTDLVANSALVLKWTRDRLDRLAGKLDAEYRREIEERAAALERIVAAAGADWRAVNADEFHAAKEALERAGVRMHEIAITEALRGEKAGPYRSTRFRI